MENNKQVIVNLLSNFYIFVKENYKDKVAMPIEAINEWLDQECMFQNINCNTAKKD